MHVKNLSKGLLAIAALDADRTKVLAHDARQITTWWGQFPDDSTLVNNVLVVHGKQLADQLATYRDAHVPRQAIAAALSPERQRAADSHGVGQGAPNHVGSH